MSNAQRRREHRHRNKARPGPMTPQRAAEHQLAQTRLADLERLRKLVVAQLDVEERQRMAEQEEQHDVEPVAGMQGVSIDEELVIWDEVAGTQTVDPGPDAAPQDADADEAVAPCPVCGHPDAADGSLAHILLHNADEVSGAVTVDWSDADPGGGYPTPYRFRVFLVGTSRVQLYPARLTILCDASSHLAVVDVTELVNADGVPIRSTTRGKMGVHTQAYKNWARADHGDDAQFLADKFETVTSRFVLASGPGAA